MNKLSKLAVLASGISASALTFAQSVPTDAASLASGIDFTGAMGPIYTVAGALASFYVAFRVVKWVIGYAKRG